MESYPLYYTGALVKMKVKTINFTEIASFQNEIRFQGRVERLNLRVEICNFKSEAVLFRVYHNKRMVRHQISPGNSILEELKDFLILYTNFNYQFKFEANKKKAQEWCVKHKFPLQSQSCCEFGHNHIEQTLFTSKRIYCKVCDKEILK